MRVLLAPAVTSSDRCTESLRPSEFHSHYKRIVPSLT